MNKIESTDQKRIVYLLGAGASQAFNIKGTAALSRDIEEKLFSEGLYFCKKSQDIYYSIKHALYPINSDSYSNFEEIIYCAYWLSNLSINNSNILSPFLFTKRNDFSAGDYYGLIDKMNLIIADSLNIKVTDNEIELLKYFFENIRNGHYLNRIYTLNYDSLLSNSLPNYYNGFIPPKISKSQSEFDPKRKVFDSEGFFSNYDSNCYFPLHGSIHFGNPKEHEKDFVFYDDPPGFWDGGIMSQPKNKMGGTKAYNFPIITGFHKDEQILNTPFRFYYSALGMDIMACDYLMIVGYGFGDTHINEWIKEARIHNSKMKTLWVDYSKEDQPYNPFPNLTQFNSFNGKNSGMDSGWFSDLGREDRIAETLNLQRAINSGEYQKVTPPFYKSKNDSLGLYTKGFKDFILHYPNFKDILNKL